MLNMGFLEDIGEAIISRVPKRKRCSFSVQKPSNASVCSLWKSQNIKCGQRIDNRFGRSIYSCQRRRKIWYHDSIDGCRATWTYHRLWSDKTLVDELTRGQKIRSFRAEEFTEIWSNKRLRVLVTLNELGHLVKQDTALSLDLQVWLMSTTTLQDTTIFHSPGSDGQVVLQKQGQSITLFRQIEMAICKSLRTAKSGWRNETCNEEAFKQKQVALKKLARLWGWKIRTNWSLVRMLANWLQNSLLKNWLCICSLTVQDPHSLPEVEIARENHCHFQPSGGGGKAAKGPWKWPSWNQRRDRNHEMTVKVDAVISNAIQ